MTRPALTIIDSNSDKPTAYDCIGAIVTAQGNLDLAAERLFGARDPRNPFPEPKAQLIATIAEDPTSFDELQKQLRVLTLLDTFSKTQTLAHVVDGTLDKQDPAILAKLYVQMLSVLTTLTDDHTQNINSQSTSVNLNLSDQVLRALPPEAREAIKVFQQNMQNGHTGPPNTEIQRATRSAAIPPPNIAVDQDEDDQV